MTTVAEHIERCIRQENSQNVASCGIGVWRFRRVVERLAEFSREQKHDADAVMLRGLARALDSIEATQCSGEPW